MSELADTVRRTLEAWNRRDMEVVAAAVTEDCEWIEQADHPINAAEGQTGVSAVEQVTDDLDADFDGYTAEVLDVVEVGGDRVVAILRECATGATSGARVETEMGYVITVRDGKACRIEVHRDPALAWAAVGHDPPA